MTVYRQIYIQLNYIHINIIYINLCLKDVEVLIKPNHLNNFKNDWLKISSKKGKVFNKSENFHWYWISNTVLCIIKKALYTCLQFPLTDLKYNIILYTDLQIKK